MPPAVDLQQMIFHCFGSHCKSVVGRSACSVLGTVSFGLKQCQNCYNVTIVTTLQLLQRYDCCRLRGCIPLPVAASVSFDGTGLRGFCPSSKQEIELQQSDTIRTMLQPLLNAGPQKWGVVDSMSAYFDKPLSNIWFGEDGKDVRGWRESDDRGWVGHAMRIIDSVAYTIIVDAEGAGLDLTILPDFVVKLPRLELFLCKHCNYNSQNVDAMQLPASLAAKAPTSLQSLGLAGSGVAGPLPNEWGQWSSLFRLALNDNNIKGTLPASWSNMTFLYSLDLSNNPDLTGTIPSAWATFQAAIFLQGTSVEGCIPDQLLENIFWDKPYTSCSQNSPELSQLLVLRQLLNPAGWLLATWVIDSAPAQKPGDEIATAVCVTAAEAPEHVHFYL